MRDIHMANSGFCRDNVLSACVLLKDGSLRQELAAFVALYAC